ncbi:Lipid-A-disaccharide synthase [hydrothermal vent metagenome]|uniref:lipid-A-disaccharide synthase n=1 Tax=hydrothermal vent metagenome TaxID=652676 RepID=A0A3B1C4T6_9ZZZZ
MRVMIIAGEASGDQHSARLVEAVHTLDPTVEFFGIGGECMRRAGVDIRVDSAEMAVVGLIEIWAHRKVIFGALDKMREILKTDPPDLLFLTDYPEFNLRLAKTAKQLGIKVLFYISPQIWAWRQWRVKKIRKLVDMMAVIFPFELDFYHQHHVPVRFVGHPLADEVHASAERDHLCTEFGLDAQQPVVGLFPGSRQSEVKRLMPIIVETAKRLKQQNPKIQFLLPIASTLKREHFSSYLDGDTPAITMLENRSYDIMAACNAIITVSGTVTLEIALIGTPMVIINRISNLSYLIAKQMVKVDHIGLCNIVAGKRIVPELIQYEAKAGKIADEIIRMLNDIDYDQSIRNELQKVRKKLSSEGKVTNLAELTMELLNPNSAVDC